LLSRAVHPCTIDSTAHSKQVEEKYSVVGPSFEHTDGGRGSKGGLEGWLLVEREAALY
jgi:hypothetical protein